MEKRHEVIVNKHCITEYRDFGISGWQNIKITDGRIVTTTTSVDGKIISDK